MSKTSVPPHVVILGAGYAGAMVARSLENDARLGKVSVTVVERREAVHHKIGAIRASVRAGEWTDRVRIPLSRILRHGRTMVGNVVEIDEVNNLLKFKDEAQPALHFDILICATGECSGCYS
jgi:NADH dehydrogenase FAD-containing subunit